MSRFATLPLVALLFSGCSTQLDVRPQRTDAYEHGLPAVLPYTRFELTETWRLTSCSDPANPVTFKIEGTAGEAIDEQHRYLIDPTSLQGELTTSRFEVTYFEGTAMIRTVNSEVEDRTGAFIGNVVTTIARIAPLVMGVPVPPAGIRAVGGSQCTARAAEQLTRAEALKAQLDEANGNVEGATDRVLRLAAAVAQMGSAVDPQISAAYGAAIRDLQALTAVQTSLAATLADSLKPLTYQRVTRWPEDSTEFVRGAATEIDQRVLARWFTSPQPPAAYGTAYVQIEGARTGIPGTAIPLPRDRPAVLHGLPFRTPRPGRLIACDRPCAAEGAQRRTIFEGQIAQLGLVNVLPVRNPAFGSTSVTAEFRRDGSVASAGYAQRAAPLEQMSAAIAGSAGEIVPLIDPTQRLARETAYLNALKERRDAWASLQPAEQDPAAAGRAAVEADTALLNAQISNLQARLTLQELQARSNAR